MVQQVQPGRAEQRAGDDPVPTASNSRDPLRQLVVLPDCHWTIFMKMTTVSRYVGTCSNDLPDRLRRAPADTGNGEPVTLEVTLQATLEQAAEALRAIAYEHRLHLLLLLRDGERTPGALAEAADLESTLVAHHLRCLRDARLVRRQRRGRNVFYSIDGAATSQLVQDVIRFARQQR